MTVNKNILFLPGDGIGPEVCEEAKKVLLSVNELFGLDFKVSEELAGGDALEKTGNPLPNQTLEAAKSHPNLKVELGPNQGRGIASGFWMNHGGETSISMALGEDGTFTLSIACCTSHWLRRAFKPTKVSSIQSARISYGSFRSRKSCRRNVP